MNKQITIIDQVKEIESRSGVAFEIDITEVASLAERARAIVSVNDEGFPAIKRELQQKRKYVTEYFEDARGEFNKISKSIIQVQNTILDEFTPEEDRLIALGKAEKERLLKEARLEALPAKRERIAEAGIEFTDEEILALPDAEFELEFNLKLHDKVIADRLAAEAKLAEERAAFEAEKAEQARKQAEADRIEQARQEERERAEKALQLAKETAEREAREAKERAEREAREAEERRKAEEQERILRAEREAREAEEAEAKRQANAKYQAFLKKNAYNEETDIIIEGTKIYRFVAEFKK
jgi:colicin import membrane protein